MILSGLYISKEILLDSGLAYHLFYALFADESNGKQRQAMRRYIPAHCLLLLLLLSMSKNKVGVFVFLRINIVQIPVI